MMCMPINPLPTLCLALTLSGGLWAVEAQLLCIMSRVDKGEWLEIPSHILFLKGDSLKLEVSPSPVQAYSSKGSFQGPGHYRQVVLGERRKG